MSINGKVSVLIPIHNTGAYLHQCLDSVQKQTYSKLQIICINDGSTDSSPDIINGFLNNDTRFELISHENIGYGASMNRGLEHADGEYIAIVESDDFIGPDMIQKLVDFAVAYPDADFVKFAYIEYFEYPDKPPEKVFSPLATLCIPDPFYIAEHPEMINYHPSIWSALYRSNFLKKFNIRFVEAPGAGWTDNPFFMETLIRANKLLWRPETQYFYRQTNPMSSSNLKDCTIPFLRMLDIFDFIDKYGEIDIIILKRHYQRCFFYMKLVEENPNYNNETVYPLMVKVALRMRSELVADSFFSDEFQNIYKKLMEATK